MEIKEKGNFQNISVNDAGTGVIITKRINDEWVKKHAHLYSDGYYPSNLGKIFRASNSGFLTAENNRVIVRLPKND